MSLLVIIPCGKKKIWDKYPSTGPTAAREAYTGPPFKVNREFAEFYAKRGANWLILSAKYGFVEPHSLIENYNVCFKDPCHTSVSMNTLRDQVKTMELGRHQRVIALGGKEYIAAVKEAFSGTDCIIEFPTEGLQVGKAMGRLKELMRTSCYDDML